LISTKGSRQAWAKSRANVAPTRKQGTKPGPVVTATACNWVASHDSFSRRAIALPFSDAVTDDDDDDVVVVVVEEQPGGWRGWSASAVTAHNNS
jgi:hypothetical protein